ncbi:glutathione peroxidase [Melghiribacillus thermohalophilus]|uniref:Glutathione peroxidase n=1 Tax=Melghiribacillus thermohalophilus TaxID=1324956 RepID=A0A4R3MU41_9BACI|nr:glutathione peroxidase [Melghiribacillus thermohalophilus]TCT19980.1 glutathione peroxidase [Melghiribacillus thermohalophilus]
MSVYDFKVVTIEGEEKPLSDYRGKVLLIVNTASKCGFTPQYRGLQKLYETYQDQGFEVLGFPCNQFANQEPGTDEEIKQFCSVNYQVTFPMFSKVEVNGEQAHPLFTYLRKQAPGVLGISTIKWNFTKFLVDREGNVVKRFAPNTEPEQIEDDIKKYL